MEFKKELMGGRVFVKELGREVEIAEENKVILLRFPHLFNTSSNDPKKTKIPSDREALYLKACTIAKANKVKPPSKNTGIVKLNIFINKYKKDV